MLLQKNVKKNETKNRRERMRRRINNFCSNSNFDTVEFNLKLYCEKWHVDYVPPEKAEESNEKRSRRQDMRRKLKALELQADKDNLDNIERKLNLQCDKWGISYIEPIPNESKYEKDCRQSNLIKHICKIMRMEKLLVPTFDHIESQLEKHCEEWAIIYENPTPKELLHQTRRRRQRMRTEIKKLKMESYKNSDHFVISNVMNTLVDKVDEMLMNEEENESNIMHLAYQQVQEK